MKLNLRLLFLISLFTFHLSLYSQQVSDSLTAPPVDSLTAKLDSNTLNWSTLSLRSKMVWNDGSNEQEFQGSVRMQKDSLLWMSLFGPFGIEGARVLITPDTFKIMNRIAGEYAIRSIGFLQEWLYLPVSFTMLQQLVTGKRASIGEARTAVTTEDSLYVLYIETDKMQQKVWVHPQSYTISKIVLKDKLLQQSMSLTFEAYNLLNEKPFSYKRFIEISRGSQKMQLSMDITKATANEELTYPFEIAERYKKIE